MPARPVPPDDADLRAALVQYHAIPRLAPPGRPRAELRQHKPRQQSRRNPPQRHTQPHQRRAERQRQKAEGRHKPGLRRGGVQGNRRLCQPLHHAHVEAAAPIYEGADLGGNRRQPAHREERDAAHLQDERCRHQHEVCQRRDQRQPAEVPQNQRQREELHKYGDANAPGKPLHPALLRQKP